MRQPKHQPYRQRYNDLHFQHIQRTAPNVVKDGFYTSPKFPVVTKSNGLTQYIMNFINWSEYRATRINTMGRQINGKWIHSATRRGSADISSTIKGKSVMWEIKTGRDKPRPEQLEEQAREIAAGGQYYFVHTPDEFLSIFDSI